MLVEAGEDPRVPPALHATLQALARQWRALGAAADAQEKRIKASTRVDATTRRLMTIPGVGPITAHAVVAAIGDRRQFRTARDFAAWVGLTPREFASGQKRRSGRISRGPNRSAWACGSQVFSGVAPRASRPWRKPPGPRVSSGRF